MQSPQTHTRQCWISSRKNKLFPKTDDDGANRHKEGSDYGGNGEFLFKK